MYSLSTGTTPLFGLIRSLATGREEGGPSVPAEGRKSSLSTFSLPAPQAHSWGMCVCGLLTF